uniref:Uncharacterized protein n=1 Tax=Scophthalmus maximus TaxID=52904 RepID=A0A8D3BNI2_SCOMX
TESLTLCVFKNLPADKPDTSSAAEAAHPREDGRCVSRQLALALAVSIQKRMAGVSVFKRDEALHRGTTHTAHYSICCVYLAPPF